MSNAVCVLEGKLLKGELFLSKFGYNMIVFDGINYCFFSKFLIQSGKKLLISIGFIKKEANSFLNINFFDFCIDRNSFGERFVLFYLIKKQSLFLKQINVSFIHNFSS